jgi:hypothetical protein
MRVLLCIKYINEQILLFDLTTLPCELYLHRHNVFLASSSSENQKVDRNFSNPAFKKDGYITHEKCHFLLGMAFLLK